MPVTTEHEAFLPPPRLYAGYRAYLQTATAAHGARFVDYNDHSLWQEPQDFADTHHLNRTGAKRISSLVANDVLIPALRDLGWQEACARR